MTADEIKAKLVAAKDILEVIKCIEEISWDQWMRPVSTNEGRYAMCRILPITIRTSTKTSEIQIGNTSVSLTHNYKLGEVLNKISAGFRQEDERLEDERQKLFEQQFLTSFKLDLSSENYDKTMRAHGIPNDN